MINPQQGRQLACQFHGDRDVSGRGFSASRSLCYKSSFWFSIFISLTNCGRQKLLACLPLPAVPGLDQNCGIPFLYVTAELSLLILQGHREPRGAFRASEKTFLCGHWQNCLDPSWLGRRGAGTRPTVPHFLQIPFFSAAISSQAFC